MGFKELDRLESEAIFIMREVASEAEKPVTLYSIGKDSSVMLHLAEKAFYPEPIPFPLMHIDKGWKFKEMIAFRDSIAKEHNTNIVQGEKHKGLYLIKLDMARHMDVYIKGRHRCGTSLFCKREIGSISRGQYYYGR